MSKKIPGAGLLLLILLFSACPEKPDENPAVDSITIKNIPKTYADKNQPAQTRASYKVYVNASNKTGIQDKHAAQGTYDLSEDDFSGGFATITIPLFNPLDGDNYKGADPDEHGERWKGEAQYFSVVISPAEAPNEESIFVKASSKRLDKSISANCDFSKLIDLWQLAEGGVTMPGVGDLKDKVRALYSEIVCKDNKTGEGMGSSIIAPNP
jgi:hypothetical protein